MSIEPRQKDNPPKRHTYKRRTDYGGKNEGGTDRQTDKGGRNEEGRTDIQTKEVETIKLNV